MQATTHLAAISLPLFGSSLTSQPPNGCKKYPWVIGNTCISVKTKQQNIQQYQSLANPR